MGRILKAFDVRNYNFIEEQTCTQIGVVAQEVKQSVDNAGVVTESPDIDEEGRPAPQLRALITMCFI